MTLARCGAIVLVSSLIIGCTEPADTADADSIQTAGSTEIQEGQLDTLPTATMLALPVASLQEELRIDGYEADLVPIHRLMMGGEGEIVVTQTLDAALVVFDARGERQGSFGRRGSGPGEFQTIGFLGWRGDSIWVTDPRQRRMTFIAPDLENSRSFQLGTAPVRFVLKDSSFVYRIDATQGLTAEGLAVKFLSVPVGRSAPAWAPASAIAVVGHDGLVTTMLDSIPNVALRIETESGGMLGVRFNNLPAYVLSADGERLAIASAPPAGQPASHVTVSVTAIDGTRLSSRAYPLTPDPLPRAVWDSMVESIPRGMLSRDLLEVLLATPPPVSYPPVQGIVFSREHRVWVRVHDASGLHYLVLSPKASLSAGFRSPRTVRSTLRTAT
jgi:hypothetical protein